MSTNLGSLGQVWVEAGVDLSSMTKQLSAAVATAGQQGEAIGKAISSGVAREATFDEIRENLAKGAKDAQAAAEAAAKAIYAPFGEAAIKAGQAIQEIGRGATQMGKDLSLNVTVPIVALGAAAIKSFSDIDSLKRGLIAVAGSATEANKQFEELREVAKLPGLGLAEAVQGSVRLQAFGFSAGEAKAALLSFGNAVATVGGGKAELDRVIIQLGQMAGASKVLNQDLRPIIQTVPQVAGIIREQFGPQFVSEPGKNFAALGMSGKQLVEVLTRELGKLPAVTGGIKNDLENFSDASKLALSKLGEAMAPLVHTVMEFLVPAMNTLVGTFASLPGSVQGVVVGLTGIAAAAGPTLIVVGKLSTAFGQVAESLGRVDVFLKAAGISVTGLTGLLGPLLLALASAGAAIAATWGQLETLNKKYDAFAETAARTTIYDLLNTGKTIEEIQKLGYSLDDIKKAIIGIGEESKTSGDLLLDMVRRGAKAKELFEQGFSSGEIEAAFAKMRDGSIQAAKAQTDLAGAVKNTTETLGIHVKAVGESTTKHDEGTVAVKTHKKAHDELEPSIAKTAKAQADLAKKMSMEVLPAFDAIKGHTTQGTQALEAMFASLRGPAMETGTVKVVNLGNMAEQLGIKMTVMAGASANAANTIAKSFSILEPIMQNLAGEIQLVATQIKNTADMAAGFRASGGFAPSGGFGGQGGTAGGGTFVAPKTSGLAPGGAKAGDIKDISGLGTPGQLPMGGTAGFNSLMVTTWTDAEIEMSRVVDLLVKNGYKATEVGKLMRQAMDAKVSVDSMIQMWNNIRVASTAAAEAGKKQLEVMKVATDEAAPGISDLTDQLWRLIEAGKGNTQAAVDLRTQISSMGGYMNQAATAAANAGGAFKQATAVMSQAGYAAVDMIVKVASTAQARGYTLPTGLTPVTATTAGVPRPTPRGTFGPAPLPGVSTSGPSAQEIQNANNFALNQGQNYPSLPSLPNVAGPSTMGGGMAPVAIYITNMSADYIGAQVTQILRAQAGYN